MTHTAQTIPPPRIFTSPPKLAMLALLWAALWMVYAPSLRAPLIFDDQASIVENPSIKTLWPLIGDAQHRGPLNPPPGGALPTAGRPLVNLSLAINYHFGKLDPLGYHVLNLIIHCLAATLLWRIIARTLRLEFFQQKFDRAAESLGLVAAIFWGVHPLNIDAVQYITQRTEAMAGLFYFATLYCSLRYWATKNTRIPWLIAASLSCMAGAACKEVLATAPLIVLLFDYTFIDGSLRGAWRRSWALCLGLMLSWILFIAMNINAPRSGSAGFHVQDTPPPAWWMTQCKVLLMYLKLTIWPWPLAIHYGFPLLRTLAAAWPFVIAAALIISGTIILLWQRKATGFIGAWVLGILSPTLIVPLLYEPAAERRMYLPLAGLAALIVVGGFTLLRKMGSRTAIIAAAIVVLIFMAISEKRLADFRVPLSLWQKAVRDQPEDFISQNSFAVELEQAGRAAEAIEHYQRAAELNPRMVQLQFNLASALGRANRTDEAVAHLQQALAIDPHDADLHNGVGTALASLGKTSEAIEQFREAIELAPDLAQPHVNLGNVLLQSGDIAAAIGEYQRAIQLKADFFEAHNNLGAALMRSGQTAQAIEQYQQAMRINPDDAQAYVNLALAYAKVQRSADAIATARKALQLAQAQGDVVLAARIRAWLSHYGE